MKIDDAILLFLNGKLSAKEIKKRYSRRDIENALIDVFKNSVWINRKKAANILVKLPKDELYTLLKRRINLRNEDIAFWSLKLALHLPLEQSIEIIKGYLISNNKNIRIFAVNALAKWNKTPIAISILIDRLNDPKWSVRKESADILSSNKNSIPYLIKRFRNATENQSYWIIRILGRLIPDKNIGVLIKFLNKVSNKNRLFAIMALSERKSIKAIPSLINCLGDKSWLIRKQTAEVLTGYGLDAVDYLKKVLTTSKNSDIKYWSAQILARILHNNVLDFFYDVYVKARKDIDLRNYVLLAVSNINHENSAKILIRAFDDEYWLVRKQAYEVAVKIGNKIVAPLVLSLEKAFREDNENVCHWGLKVLLNLKGEALNPIRQYLKGSNVNIKQLIMLLLYEFKDIQTIDILIDALTDASWGVRSKAAKTIVKIGDNGIFKLVEYLKKQKVPIHSDLCYWTKKILLDSNKKKLYDELLNYFDVKDLLDLSRDKLYEEDIEYESDVKGEDSQKILDIDIKDKKENINKEKIEEETEEEKEIKNRLNVIFKDLLSPYEEVGDIAYGSLEQITDNLPDNLIKLVVNKLEILHGFLDENFSNKIKLFLKKISERFNIYPDELHKEDLEKFLNVKQFKDKWEKLKFLYLVYKFHPERAKQVVLRMLENENDFIILKMLFRVILFYPDSLISDKLNILLYKEEFKRIKRSTIYVLGNIKVPRSVIVLIPLLNSEYHYDVVKSIINLGEALIIKAIKDLTFIENFKDWGLALKLLENINIYIAKDIILKGLKSKNKDIRDICIAILTYYIDENFINVLKNTGFSEDTEVLIRGIISDFYKGKINIKIPKSVEEWSDFFNKINLDYNKKISKKNINDFQEKDNKKDEKIESVQSSNDNELKIPENPNELKIKIAELSYEYYKKGVLIEKSLLSIFKELDKIEESIEKRKDYLFKLNSDEDADGNILEKFKKKLQKKQEIEETERFIEQLFDKRNKKIKELADTIILLNENMPDLPLDIKDLLKGYKK